MNALLKPIYPSKGEAESWWASLQRTIWGSPAAIVQDPPEEIDLQSHIVQQAATSHPPPSTTVDSGSAAEIACRILTEVTGSTVDPNSKYESLGLTSMQMVEFRNQLSEALGAEGIPLKGLMLAEGTVGEVIGRLAIADGDGSLALLPPLEPPAGGARAGEA